MSLTFRNRRFQWAGKHITDRQMTRALALKELTQEPISVMIQRGLELYLAQEESRIQETNSQFATDTIQHAPI